MTKFPYKWCNYYLIHSFITIVNKFKRNPIISLPCLRISIVFSLPTIKNKLSLLWRKISFTIYLPSPPSILSSGSYVSLKVVTVQKHCLMTLNSKNNSPGGKTVAIQLLHPGRILLGFRRILDPRCLFQFHFAHNKADPMDPCFL